MRSSSILRLFKEGILILGALTTFSFRLASGNEAANVKWSSAEGTASARQGAPLLNECKFKLDFVFLLDTSWSYLSRYPHLTRRLPAFHQFVMTNFPGSRFGVSSFIDPPLCAGARDYCASTRLSLDHPQSNDLGMLEHVIGTLPIGNGRDTPENLYGGALRIMHSKKTGWESPALEVDPQDGRRPLRLLFAITDAIGHVAPNKQACSPPGSPQLEPFPLDPSSDWLSESVNEACNKIEYPTIDHLPVYVARTRIHPLFYFTHLASTRGQEAPNPSLHRMSLYFGSGYNLTAESHPKLLADPTSWTLVEDIHRYVFSRFHNFSPVIGTGWDDFLGFETDAAEMITEIATNVCADLLAPPPTTTTTTTSTTTLSSTSTSSSGWTTTIPEGPLPETTEGLGGDGNNVNESTVPEETSSTTYDSDAIGNRTVLSGAAIAAGAAVAGAATMYMAGRLLQYVGRDPEGQAFLEDAELQDVAVDREVHTEVEDFFC